MAPPTALARDFACRHCGKSFGRAEHLRRHQLIHTQATCFACQHCPKTFVRRDAQQRHELTHLSAPTLLQLGARACTHCATAKVRCSGENPCLRCQGRNLHCIHPDVREAVSTSQHGFDPTPHAGAITRPNNHNPQAFEQNAMIMELNIPSDATVYDPDFWDLNSLTNANWLDGLAANGLADFPLLGLATPLPANTTQGVDSTVWTLSSTASTHTPHDAFSIGDGSSSQAGQSQPRSIRTDTTCEDTETDEEGTQIGRLYVDGEAARLPRSKRRKLSIVRSSQRKRAEEAFSLALENSPELQVSDKYHVQEGAYAGLQRLYGQLCLDPGLLWPAFEQVELPSPAIFQHLVHLYFKNFDQVLPFLDRVEIIDSMDDALLVLSMAAIGSFYSGGAFTTHSFAVSLQEFLRRALVHSLDTHDWQAAEKYRPHIRILHLIGMTYCGDARLGRYALEHGHMLMETFISARRGVKSSADTRTGGQAGTLEEQWKVWRSRESATRLACAAWLIDCMRRYHLDMPTALGNTDATIPLPSHEKLWNANSPREWVDVARNIPQTTQDLRDVLSELYLDKRLAKGLGEFARIIIIHGLFHRLWEVERYFSDPLSGWEPVAKREASSDILLRSPIWLPAIPTFTKWQNSTCDALDILHWQANATIGQASGLEHPTVLHLHVARLVLLAPLANIISLAQARVAGSPTQTSDQEVIRRWAIHHQYKARLSIVHAGVVFWHVRRYSVNGFYEAPAVALAALTLWAFGTFAGGRRVVKSSSIPSTRRQSLQAEAHDGSDDAECSIILIDRPTDDELVQQFIKHGSTMRIHLSGVGDLYEDQGPKRVLLQGCKLLNTLKCWGVSETWLELLNKFAGVSQT